MSKAGQKTNKKQDKTAWKKQDKKTRYKINRNK